MDYRNYKASRDLSWQILIREEFHSLPIKVSEICGHEKITLGKYGANEDLLSKLRLSELCKQSDGFAVKMNDKVFIFYNDRCSPARQRFTIAHELGHFFLGHTGRKTELCEVTLRNKEPSETDAEPEMQANVFASRLLAPACVLWGLQIKTAEEIARVCEISLPAAQFRMNRMQQLYARETFFQKHSGKSCFLLSPLELQVYEQFHDFIAEKRSENFSIF